MHKGAFYRACLCCILYRLSIFQKPFAHQSAMRTSSLLLVLGVVLAACSGPRTVEHDPTCLTCVGTSLGYHLSPENNGFGVNIMQNDEEGLMFAFAFANSDGAGTVRMSPLARESALTLMNYFGSEDYELTNTTSVWLSRSVFRDLTDGESVTLDLGGGDIGSFSEVDQESDRYDVTLPDGEALTVETRRFVDEQQGFELIVLDNEDDPLILKMSVAFDIELVRSQ